MFLRLVSHMCLTHVLLKIMISQIGQRKREMSDKRVYKTQEQIRILEDLYTKGMTSYGRDHEESKLLIEEAVQKTGLTAIQVKVLIINSKGFLFTVYIG